MRRNGPRKTQRTWIEVVAIERGVEIAAATTAERRIGGKVATATAAAAAAKRRIVAKVATATAAEVASTTAASSNTTATPVQRRIEGVATNRKRIGVAEGNVASTAGAAQGRRVKVARMQVARWVIEIAARE